MVEGGAIAGGVSGPRLGTPDGRTVDGLRQRLRFVPFATFAGALVLVAALSLAGHRATNATDQIRFELVASDIIARLVDRVATQIAMLDGVGAMHNVSPDDFDAERFRAYVNELALKSRHPGLDGVGFVRKTRADLQDEAAETISGMYGQPVAIHPRIADGTGYPVTVYEQAEGERRSALGYDMWSDRERRTAMERAALTATRAATGRVALGPSGRADEQGFIVFRPVYTRGATPVDGDARMRRLVGFAFAAFRSEAFFASVLDASLLRLASVEVWDGDPDVGNLLFRSAADVGSSFETFQPIDVAGQTYTVRVKSSNAFDAAASSRFVPPLMALGLLLAAAAAALARQGILVRIGEAEERAAEAAAARDKDLLLQEMKHRIKNAFARVQAVARQTARSSADLDSFVGAFESRLSAMSATHDLLTRSRWEGADLREVLVAELEPVIGAVGDAIVLSGPALRLEARQVLALGLTVHELATNAVKYGGVSLPGGGLSIRWRIETGPRGTQDAVVDWVERRSPEAPPADTDPARSGFGSRLIETTVVRELGGTYERWIEPTGLTCRISFPVTG